jgi:hypothetical protein
VKRILVACLMGTVLLTGCNLNNLNDYDGGYYDVHHVYHHTVVHHHTTVHHVHHYVSRRPTTRRK